MTPLVKWIAHRAAVVKLTWPNGVADAAGVEPAKLHAIGQTGSLRQVGRSTRGYLARALKVSVRELEALSDRRIDWIDDAHIIDLDQLATPSPRAAGNTPRAILCPHGLGVPIIGEIVETGELRPLEPCADIDAPRLSVRYAGLPDAFAVVMKCALHDFRAACPLVLNPILAGELREQQIVLLTHSREPTESALYIVGRIAGKMNFEFVSLGTGEIFELSIVEILRVSLVVATFPSAN